MKLVKTVKCKVQVDDKERAILHETLRRFAAACNDILEVAIREGTSNKVKLQHLCYYQVKEKYGLQANLVIRAIARVAEAIKVAKKRKKVPQAFCPSSLSLDARTFSFNEREETISVATHDGRLKGLKLHIGNFQRGLLRGQKPTAATLSFSKSKRQFYINIVVDREVPFPEGSNPIGIDRGIYNLATTSNGQKFSGKQAMHIRNHYANLRSKLQAKGTRGAKRLLKRLSGKERRWMADLNHRISKEIISACKPGDVLVMEDLTHIRERIRLRRKQRRIAHSWAFGQLQAFIEYNALEQGIPVAYVDPRYTSQTCPRCGTVGRSQRNGHRFSCKSCEFKAHADIVASVNIARAFRAPDDGLLSASPKVATPQG